MALFGIDDLIEEVSQVRALRAAPPGRATSTSERRLTFGAALEQFEQLLLASQAAGPASSPLLLFYALSQAGRAIVSAHGDPAHKPGHGLSVKPVRDRIGATTIKPEKAGLFPAVVAAVGSPPLTKPVTLSAVWGAVPGLPRAPGLGDDSPPTLSVSANLRPEVGKRIVRNERGAPFASYEDFVNKRHLYPALSKAATEPLATDVGVLVEIVAFDAGETLSGFDASLLDYLGSRYLRAPLGEGGDDPSALMTWWIVLIALSQLARYEPAGWTAALAPESGTAVPIERGLRRIALLMPRMVREALLPGP